MRIDARQERFDQVELFGRPALFTNSRIDRMTAPKGLYCYDLRGSDSDPGRPITVEPKVAVNHAGTVITADPVDMRGKDYRPLRGKLNFLGGEAGLMDFLAERGMEYVPGLKYEPRAADESEAALFFSAMKTGARPMKTTLRLFLGWGIEFGKPYEIEERTQRRVAYADKQEPEEEIIRRHHGDMTYPN